MTRWRSLTSCTSISVFRRASQCPGFQGDRDRGADYASTAGNTERTDDVEAVLPVPYGANYRATKTGFHVSMRDYSYAEGAKLLNDQDTFDEFVDALNAGKIVINIHTDKFPDGEISGKVIPN